MISCPGFMAPRFRPLRSGTFAAWSSSHEVAGVRSSKVKERSGRTVTRAGIGTPGLICAVLALNSCWRPGSGMSTSCRPIEAKER